MKKELLGLLVVVLVLGLMVGCPTQVETPKVPSSNEPITSGEDVTYIDISADYIVSTSSGKIVIRNYYGGARVECPIVFTNYSDTIVNIGLTYIDIDALKETTSKQPDGSEIPYIWLSEARDWVTIQDTLVEVLPNQSSETMVVLESPSRIDVPERWEFRVWVNNESQTAMIRTAFDERFLVNMR